MVSTGVGNPSLQKKLVPLFYSDSSYIKGGIIFDIFDKVKECRRVIGRLTRAGEVSIVLNMPLIEVLVILVNFEFRGNSLLKECMN